MGGIDRVGDAGKECRELTAIDPGDGRLGGFGARRAGRKGPSFHSPGERFLMLALLLILLLLAVLFGGFFVFSLKVAIVVAIVLLLAGAFGGYSYRGRRAV